MKAVIYEEYGPPEVLKLKQIEKPQPKENEILVKIHAATVTSGDVRLRSSDFPPLFWLPARLIFGLFKPKKKILGHEFAGVVEETGKNVSGFNVGDEVFGTTTMLKTGSYAEYICLPEKWKGGVLNLKPQNLSFHEAAALPVGAMTAIYFLEKAKLKNGQNVLIYGASGSVGSYAVQIATQKGSRVTGVCSTSNFEMVRSLGAENLIDYKKEDYSEGNEKFDIIFDAVGKTTKSKAKKVFKNGGIFVSIKTMTKEKDEHLKLIKEMAEKGILKPFIDRYFKLDEIVKAHEYVDRGRKKGNVVIDIAE
ncbi:NAD(P)-dependent alcohol dehydrogenase [Salinimicrobium sediminilitoris]|uniref:NAD(P)-dependent alcohol dehydrogenase n=1 Tax=Salinimicrobium sediminilitoris TaxID=2876715 RepID=UPI001E391E43|nr:NAD(P)-dependent alcohol dehydrogenase [Salinimicrobium sediminilitoris]MCC8360194.1 NAD(P)-dependent alcohol dehydrogenase [Salinimicrobium sediminilitoris]